METNLSSSLSSSINRKMTAAPTRSVIDPWLIITGSLQSEGEILVEGEIKGDVRCAQLIVGKDATLSGNVIAEEVIIRGKVKGTIRANRVTLQDTAVVESDIYHKSISIEQGACFEGSSKRRDQPMTVEIEQDGAKLNAVAAQMKLAGAGEQATPADLDVEDVSAAA